ncbi:MAG: hypothetical protein NC131_06730 [Roseburia sp.]|nr:hypothetical protein [Roseburia sp.]
MGSDLEKGENTGGTDKGKRVPKTSAADKSKTERRKKISRITGIAALVIAVVTVLLIAINPLNLMETAPWVYYILLPLMPCSVIVWVVLHIRAYGIKVKVTKDKPQQTKTAPTNNEVYCTQEQVDEIGRVFDKKLTVCPVCGSGLQYDYGYKYHANMIYKNTGNDANITKTYCDDAQSKEVEERWREYKIFDDAKCCTCPKCRWDAYEVYYEYHADSYKYSGYCRKFNRGKLCSARKMPADVGDLTGYFYKPGQ